ncbi:MAG: acylneuraminate cytidylyltransferase [Spirochaetae bacterium HGW-Spirochaetae-1]|jgi:spore coat polysaccharide biosynthesis protein SpsF|nr:MAG: acylneuraminate cytidylyltransferase [Spirochaetae bacterium HGW-Spirochaetae-1]
MNKPSVIALVQARMGSTRLKSKALADLAGKPLLYHVLERTALIKGVHTVVLATSDSNENRQLMELARSMGLEAFAGPEDNVQERFYLASEQFPCDYIVRVTGDNPFTDVHYAGETVALALETSADLCSFTNLPLGVGVEIISKSALDRCRRESSLPYHYEHVTPYIKEHPELFTIVRREARYENPCGEVRLTVDTEEDLQVARLLYRALYQGKPFPLSSVLEHLKNNPELIGINSHVEQKPMTSSG